MNQRVVKREGTGLRRDAVANETAARFLLAVACFAWDCTYWASSASSDWSLLARIPTLGWASRDLSSVCPGP